MSLLAGGFAHAMLASNLIFYVYINEIKDMFKYNQTEGKRCIIIITSSFGGRHGRDRMVVGFTTTCAISAYHH
jgi:hypothetical protein